MYVLFSFALAMLVMASVADNVLPPVPVKTPVVSATVAAPLPPKRPVAHKHPVVVKKHVHHKHK